VTRPNGRRNRRRGSAALELLLVLPILVVIITATVEFAQLASGDQLVADAAARGARIAARGGDDAAVKETVASCLGEPLAASAQVTVQRTGGRATVHVELPANVVAMDLLRSIGIGLADERVVGRAVMVIE
jgi:Flp pilus assembly protein TadG